MSALPILKTKRNRTSIDWEHLRNGQNAFSNRLVNALFAKECYSDMVFYVPLDDNKVPAHSVFVVTASPILERFVTATSKEDTTIVTVPDYCPTDVLLIVLRYLYVGGSAEGIDESNVGLVLKLADFYELHEIEIQCQVFIESVLSDENVCPIFSKIHKIKNKAITDICLSYMKKKTLSVLTNGSAMAMEYEALAKLLATNQSLAIRSELDVVKSMIKWVDDKYMNSSILPVDRRKLLGDRVNMINFGSMDMDEFWISVDMFGEGFFSFKEIALTGRQINRISRNTVCEDNVVYPFASYDRISVLKEIEWFNNPDSEM